MNGTLTKRQHDILTYLIQHKERSISAKEIAAHLSVSDRTIKNDLPFVRAYAARFQSFTIETVPGKGIFLAMQNADMYHKEISECVRYKSPPSTHLDESMALIRYLINKTAPVSKYAIIEHFYISESAFYKTYQKAKNILSKFNLELKHVKGRGYSIQGKEWDKRNFIAKYEPVNLIDSPMRLSRELNRIYDTIADVFIRYEYTVTYQILQSLSSNVALSIYRVSRGHYIDSIEVKNVGHLVEYSIANEICSRLLKPYRINPRYFKHEVAILTLSILGKINYAADEALQRQINEFIDAAFAKINAKFKISFGSIEKLKLFLALHLTSLFYRIRSGTQLTNRMTAQIQKNYPLANDITLYFFTLMRERFHLTCSQDELSYITLYFNLGLEELTLFRSKKKVLILAALRHSETVLLQHKFLSWFPDQIIDITFEHPERADMDLESYDAIFAVEQSAENVKGAVTTIKIFPDETDYRKIKLALNGYTDINQITEKFKPACFFSGTVKSKDEALNIVCGNAVRAYRLDPGFSEIIRARESIESTYFGGGIAIPHPLTPITDETFASVAILDKPIAWDDNHSVQFVMLISIELGNPKAFQFWFYMSEFVRNEKYVKALLSEPNFDHLLSALKCSLGETL